MTTQCPMCGQDEPMDSEHARLERARHAVFEAWKAAPYAKRLGSALGFFDVIGMADDAIVAVRDADAKSASLAVADRVSPETTAVEVTYDPA